MKAEHVNPFIISVCIVMKDMCMLDLKIGKPSLRQQSFPEENSLIRLGLVGQLSGEVLLNFEPQTALGVVYNIMIDITPPDYCVGASYNGAATEMFTIPFSTEIGDMTIDVRIEQEG